MICCEIASSLDGPVSWIEKSVFGSLMGYEVVCGYNMDRH